MGSRSVLCTLLVTTYTLHFSAAFANVGFKGCNHTLYEDWALAEGEHTRGSGSPELTL